MALCHGSGDLVRDGCCYVNGQVCPLRWKIEGGILYEGPDLIDRGSVDAYIDSIINGKANRDRAKAQVQAVTYVCRAAVEVIANDSKLLTDRPALNAAWDAHPDYVALVRPAWDALEAMRGLPSGSYNCSSWKGEAGSQCCFAEPQSENDAKAANLHADARSVRQAGGV